MKRLMIVLALSFVAACDAQVGDRLVDPMPFSIRQHSVIGKPITAYVPPASASATRVQRWANSD